MFNRLHHHATLIIGALLLNISFAAHADDFQDANTLFKQGQYSQAMDKLNDYLAEKPKDAQARFLKGLILTEQGKTTDAMKTFSALTEDYPDLPEPYNNLAVLYAKQGQYDKARLSLEMAIRTHPSYATAHENLGDIYAKMASQSYDRALQLNPGNTATQTKLAMIQNLFADGTKQSPVRNTPVQSKIEGTAPVVAAASKLGLPQPESAVPVVSPVTGNNGEVLKTINAWAAARSSKNVKKYLAFYADDFKTPNGVSRTAWETARQKRIHKAKPVRISIDNASVTFSDNDHATVQFRQSYRTGHRKTSDNKTLLMVKSGGKWLIQEEHTN